MYISFNFDAPKGDKADEHSYDDEGYTGEWENGHREGTGKQVWADGSVYEGQWKDNLRHGKGRLIESDGAVYEGEWLNGWRHGVGKHVYADGRKYEGDFCENWYQGDGEWTWADGHVFRGVFKEHCPLVGTMIHADGTVEECEFDGKTFVWSDSLEGKRKHKTGMCDLVDGLDSVGDSERAQVLQTLNQNQITVKAFRSMTDDELNALGFTFGVKLSLREAVEALEA